MVDRFNALADRHSVQFEAWFNDRIARDRKWLVDESMWRFQYRYLPSFRFLDHIFHFPTMLFGKRPDIVVSLYAEPVLLSVG